MKDKSSKNNNQQPKNNNPQERRLFSNATDVNYNDIPKEVYEIIAKILIRVANEQSDNKTQKKT